MRWNDSKDSDYAPANAPVEEGKTYDVKIEGIGRDGDGIARVEGFVVFVPGTNVGDELKIRITSLKRRVAFAEKAE